MNKLILKSLTDSKPLNSIGCFHTTQVLQRKSVYRLVQITGLHLLYVLIMLTLWKQGSPCASRRGVCGAQSSWGQNTWSFLGRCMWDIQYTMTISGDIETAAIKWLLCYGVWWSSTHAYTPSESGRQVHLLSDCVATTTKLERAIWDEIKERRKSVMHHATHHHPYKIITWFYVH